MRNLTKHLLLMMSMAVILLSSVFAEKAMADNSWVCIKSFYNDTNSCDSQTNKKGTSIFCSNADLSKNHCSTTKSRIRCISCDTNDTCQEEKQSGLAVCVPPASTPTPTRTPTPTPIPCTVSDRVGTGYNETCTDKNGTYTDYCNIVNEAREYLCVNNLCENRLKDKCSTSNKICQVQTDGKPVCVAPTPTLTTTPTSQYDQCVTGCDLIADYNLCPKQCTCYEACRTSLGEQACFDNCNAQFGAPTPTPRTTSTTTPKLVWKQIVVCPIPTTPPAPTGVGGQTVPTSTPTPTSPASQATPTATPTLTPTPTPNLFDCTNQTTEPFAGNYQCATIKNGLIQCPSGFGDFSPSTPYTGTSCSTGQGCCKQGAVQQANLFACQNQTGTYAGNYICADIINVATQCPDNYTPFQISSSYTGTSCGVAKGCCKQNPVAPTATPTPPLPGSTVLELSLALGGIGPRNNTVQNSKIAKSPVTINVFKMSEGGDETPVPPARKGILIYNLLEGKFKGTVNLGTSLSPGKYEFKIKVDRYLQKLVPGIFTVNAHTTEIQKITVDLPATNPLLAGNINMEGQSEDTINAMDYNSILNCYGGKFSSDCKTKVFPDLNFDEKVDIIDLNIVLRNIGKTDD